MFLIGRIVSILSFQMLVVAIGWQLYTLTGSALDLGLLGIVQVVPMLVLTPLVGHVADRYDNRAHPPDLPVGRSASRLRF